MNLRQFCTQSIFGNNGTYTYCVLEWNWSPSAMVEACVKNDFKGFRVTTFTKINFSAGLSLFHKPCPKKFRLSIWVSYWFMDTNIQHFKVQRHGYYDFSAVTFSNYITYILETFSWNFSNWNGVNVQWIWNHVR